MTIHLLIHQSTRGFISCEASYTSVSGFRAVSRKTGKDFSLSPTRFLMT
jgi:hypothetical protein